MLLEHWSVNFGMLQAFTEETFHQSLCKARSYFQFAHSKGESIFNPTALSELELLQTIGQQ